jgi:hypothetical protein
MPIRRVQHRNPRIIARMTWAMDQAMMKRQQEERPTMSDGTSPWQTAYPHTDGYYWFADKTGFRIPVVVEQGWWRMIGNEVEFDQEDYTRDWGYCIPLVLPPPLPA